LTIYKAAEGTVIILISVQEIMLSSRLTIIDYKSEELTTAPCCT